MADDDGSEDVTEFLKRVRELGEQRDREDEERTRKLEQDIIQGRKEREARRAERARSISPTKSDAATPSSIRSSDSLAQTSRRIRSPEIEHDTPTPMPNLNPVSRDETKLFGAPLLKSKTQEGIPDTSAMEKSDDTRFTSAMPKRANTLSWQQRPPRNGMTGTRSRPQSSIMNQNAFDPPAPSAATLAATNDEPASRDSIAKSLAEKDPSWFKQTQDRGIGSAAYRKNNEEHAVTPSLLSTRMELPGLRQSSTEPEKSSSPPSLGRSESISRPDHNDTRRPEQKPSATDSLPTSISLPLTHRSLQNFKLDPPTSERGFNDGDIAGRISPERVQRTPSPTKGLGGFVQSAMLKRSDSVSKRWSAQATPGLSRGDSVAGGRKTVGASKPYGNYRAPTDSKSASVSRENSPMPISRPTSSQSTSLQRDVPLSNGTSRESKDTQPAKGDLQAGVNLLENRERSSSDKPSPESGSQPTLTSPPASPSKRWSPTKSSWLENAINKPESPKPKFNVPQQPNWMTNLNSAKQQKPDADPVKVGSSHEVKTTGFLRSPPVGVGDRPLSTSGLPLGFRAGVETKTTSGQSIIESEKRTVSRDKQDVSEGSPDRSSEVAYRSSTPAPGNSREATTAKQQSISPRSNRGSVPPSASPKPSGLSKSNSVTPPRPGSTSSPRTSSIVDKASDNEQVEFKNVFGKLRKTETRNYVAPDELKSNILRGKAGLNITGGPKKTERVDEFKESILKKKQEMKESQVSRVSGKPAPTSQPKPLPFRPDQGRGSLEEPCSAPQETARPGTNPTKTINAPSFTARSPPPFAQKPTKVEIYPSDSASPTTDLKNEESSEAYSIVTSSAKKASVEPHPPENSITSLRFPKPQHKVGDSFSASLAGLIARRPTALDTGVGEPSPQPSQPSSTFTNDLSPQSGKQLEHMTKSRARGPKRRAPASKAVEPAVQRNMDEVKSPTDKNPLVMSPTVSSRLLSSRRGPDTEAPTESKPSGLGISNIPKQTKGIPTSSGRPQVRVPSSSIRSPVLPTPQETRIEGDASATDSSTRLSGRVPTSTTPKTPFVATALPEVTKRADAASTSHIAKPMSPPLPSKPSNLLHSSITINPPSQSNGTRPPRSSTTTKSPTKSSPSNDSVISILASYLAPSSASSPKITVDTPHILTHLSNPPKIKTLRKSISEVGPHGSTHPLPQSLEHILFSAHLYLCVHTFSTSPISSAMSTQDQKTEVYLWTGVDVPSSQVEDAQLFARRAARDAGGKLQTIKQGKDSAEFLQAVGGVLITRRGFSSRGESPTKASATYMLRCRQHLGQIVFDEVDLAMEELCSGFPHLVSARFGKLYLWKGVGAGADELGCARLIGMDLGLTGEIEEVDEGEEPASFWNAFPAGSQPNSRSSRGAEAETAVRWKEKATCEGYVTRLFSIDLESLIRPKSGTGNTTSGAIASSFGRWVRQGSIPDVSSAPEPDAKEQEPMVQIREISPFTQDDLTPGGIFVLDSFYGLYILLRPSTLTALKPKPDTLRAACVFAQEYAILIASKEDRPRVPRCWVVVIDDDDGNSGVPEGVRMAFRRWDDGGGRDDQKKKKENEMLLLEVEDVLEWLTKPSLSLSS